jgi:hypothetical protein
MLRSVPDAVVRRRKYRGSAGQLGGDATCVVSEKTLRTTAVPGRVVKNLSSMKYSAFTDNVADAESFKCRRRAIAAAQLTSVHSFGVDLIG